MFKDLGQPNERQNANQVPSIKRKERTGARGWGWGIKKILKGLGGHIQVTHCSKWGSASVYAETGASVAVSYVKDLLVG